MISVAFNLNPTYLYSSIFGSIHKACQHFFSFNNIFHNGWHSSSVKVHLRTINRSSKTVVLFLDLTLFHLVQTLQRPIRPWGHKRFGTRNSVIVDVSFDEVTEKSLHANLNSFIASSCVYNTYLMPITWRYSLRLSYSYYIG